MRIAMFLVTAAALTLSAPLAAKSNQLAESKPTASKPADKKVWKKIAATGSRMGERVCLTKDEWKKVEEQTNG